MAPSNWMPCSISTSMTPAVNSPRMAPPSKTSPVFIVMPRFFAVSFVLVIIWNILRKCNPGFGVKYNGLGVA